MRAASSVFLIVTGLLMHALAANASPVRSAFRKPLSTSAIRASTIKEIPISTTFGRKPESDDRVALDLFVMSRCPDARRCEARIDEVLQVVGNITKVRLNFIADPLGDDQVTCKHGDIECAGDAQELCVQQKATTADTWAFLRCLYENATNIGQESLADACVERSVHPRRVADEAKACYYGREGTALLYNDAQHSHSKGIKTSCTILVDNKPRCIQDGGVWHSCPGGPEVQDFVTTICNVYWTLTGVWAPECELGSQARA